MEESIFEKNYEVTSVNINMNKRLGLFGMLGILQDVGTVHAENLGVGLDDMIRNNAFWVFTQQTLKMTTWPKWKDIVTIRTWPRALDGMKAYRDYEIYCDDKKIGKSVATFMVLDGTTRRPVRPTMAEKLTHPIDVLDFTPEKIKVPDYMPIENSVVVRNSDLDMNNHVNNTKYAQWILDTIPIQYHREYLVDEFSINFISETHLGDHIDIKAAINDETLESYYQGVRQYDGKVVFASKILGRKKF
jgi:acyl-ACP thioesterase